MTREYGQFCGLARALEIVGGRWTLLIVRDLLVGPKRFSELQEGLPGIPTNILSARLRELEDAYLVHRTLRARPFSSVVYELTPHGHDLQDAVVRLGMWGAKSLSPPKSSDFFNIASLAIALRGAFDPARAGNRAMVFEIRLNGQRIHVAVDEGEVTFPTEPPSDPHVKLSSPPEVFAELLTGRTTADSAIESGRLEITGPRALARQFFEIFRLPNASNRQRNAMSKGEK